MSKITKLHEYYTVDDADTTLRINFVDGEFLSGTLKVGSGTMSLNKDSYGEICILIDKMRGLIDE